MSKIRSILAATMFAPLIISPIISSATGTAEAASARAVSACPSAHTMYRGLNRRDRRHAYRSKRYGIPYGIEGIHCAHRWATAELNEDYGSGPNAYTLLEHRSRGMWREINRDRPCARHKVPAKIYFRACETN